jgi:hypothetical protein
MKPQRDKDIDRRFIFERRLVVCPVARCRKSCHCKGVGFYYSIAKTQPALMHESFKKAFTDIDVCRFEQV